MRKMWLVLALGCIPVLGFAQQIHIVGRVPPGNSTSLYRLQVGAFLSHDPALNTYERLRQGGLDPVYEQYQDFRRVVLVELRAGEISTYIERIRTLGFREVWIRDDIPDERWQRVQVQNQPRRRSGRGGITVSAGGADDDFVPDPDYMDYHNLIIDVENRGVLKIHSKTKADGYNEIEFSYTNAETGEERTFTVNTDDLERSNSKSSNREVHWDID